MSDRKPEFKPKHFWEAIYYRPLNECELAEVDARSMEFIKFLRGAQLEQKRRKLQLEIYKIDYELNDLERGFLPYLDQETLRKKFESALASTKIRSQK